MTIEGQKKEILKMVDFMSPYDIEHMRKRLTRLVADVRAEGAERAKADIWKAQLYGYRVQLYPFPHDEREGLRVETEVNGMQYVMVPVASVLAPRRGSE